MPPTVGNVVVTLVAQTHSTQLWSDTPTFELPADLFCSEVARFLDEANRGDLFAGQYIYSIVRVSPGLAQCPDAPVHVLHEELYAGDREHARSVVAAAAFEGAVLDVSLRRAGHPLEHKIVQITSPGQ